MKVLLFLLFLFSFVVIAQEDDGLDPMAHRRRLQEATKALESGQAKQYLEANEKRKGTSEYVELPSKDDFEKLENFDELSDEEQEATLDNLKKKYLPKLKKNPLADKPKEEVRDIVLKRVEGSTWETLFRNNPSILNFIVDLMSHEDAFIRFASILSKPKKLRRYFYCFLVVVIISMYWNFKLPRELTFMVRLRRKTLFYFGALLVNFGSFYVIFNYELSPLAHIFWKNFGWG
jgi:hypothetical protein